MFGNGTAVVVISFFFFPTMYDYIHTTTANFCDHHSRRVVGSIINLQYSEKRENCRVLENKSKSLLLPHFRWTTPKAQKYTLDFKVLVLVNFWSKNENIWSWTIRQILFLVWKFKWDICGHFPTMWTVWLLSSFKTLLLFVCVWRTKELLMSLIIIRVLITLTTIFMVFNEGDGCYSGHGGYVILIFLPDAFL